jgi:hypothetical protein
MHARVPDVVPAVRYFLTHGTVPPADDQGGPWLEAFQLWGDALHPGGGADLRARWARIGADLVAEWVQARPGTRPWGWWRLDAPRWRREDFPPRVRDLGDVFLRDLAEPRRRLGGVGTPAYEVLNEIPLFAAGVPTHWVTAFHEAYYNGRARDIHGTPIGVEYHEGDFAGVAPRADDPPTFESEAAYLARHGMLSAAERRRLPKAAFAPVALVLEPDEPDEDA